MNQHSRCPGWGGSRAIGVVFHGIVGLGWEGWRVVVVTVGWEWGTHNTGSTFIILSPMALNLTFPDLTNVELETISLKIITL